MSTKFRLFIPILLLVAVPASSAELTTVMSAADKADPFDGMLSISYDWQLRQTLISREFQCDPTIAGCPSQPMIVTKPELKSKRVSHNMNIDLRFGLYHDLELNIRLPIVIQDQLNLGFATGVDRRNSQVDPGLGRSLFEVPNNGQIRSGFGDMAIGIRWAPLVQWRQPKHPNLVFDVTYTAPSGKVREAYNTAVGMGLHQLHIEVAASKLWRFIEPYFSIFGDLRFPSPERTLFTDYGAEAQILTGPGQKLGMKMGAEWFPWRWPRKDNKPGQYLSIDTGLAMSYTFRGREATDLFEALGSSSCASNPACLSSNSLKNMAAYDRTLAGAQGGPRSLNGITDVSAYGTIGAWAGIHLQSIQYFEVSLLFMYQRELPHYLTTAVIGKDLSNPRDGRIEYVNANGANEFNPVYNSDIDEPGRRFKSEGTNIFGVMVRLSGKI